ncbi:hypothetical protein N9O95_04065 [Alphaproteobacteria bacterium]|jgi:hypothetical protein|nr:hypothetical protein [Alphaproteobacteria bacterium]
MTSLISRLRPLLNQAITAPLLLVCAASTAFALNAPDEEVTVRKLTAEEILEITVNKTWIVDFDNLSLTATTFYKDTGERFTERQGEVERMQWFVDEAHNRRCVHSSFGTRCGFIVSFDETVKICMRLEPLGDCSYTVVRIEDGDYFNLESRAGFLL